MMRTEQARIADKPWHARFDEWLVPRSVILALEALEARIQIFGRAVWIPGSEPEDDWGERRKPPPRRGLA